jgi:6-phosphogluconolactonase
MIRVFDNPARLSLAAAGLIADRARQAVARRGRFCMALSGGRTPLRTYQQLGRPPFRDRVPWAQSHLFWGDERCVAENDPRSNFKMAREALLDRVPLPPGQVHPIRCAADPQSAAQAYQTLLQGFFSPAEARFDLVLLGLGEDGHTASLIPGTSAPLETLRLVTALQRIDEDFARVTLTAPAINLARLVVFLVSGRSKATILHRVLQGPPGQFPAQLIAPHEGEVIWLVDKAAAGGYVS